MSIDANLLRKARKVALEKNTSVNALVREYLEKVSADEKEKVEVTIRKMRAMFTKHRVKIGPITWKRDDLYER